MRKGQAWTGVTTTILSRTLDVEVDPLAHGGRDVVGGDAEVCAHVLRGHLRDVQGGAQIPPH